jgi:hypothetical protein
MSTVITTTTAPNAFKKERKKNQFHTVLLEMALDQAGSVDIFYLNAYILSRALVEICQRAERYPRREEGVRGLRGVRIAVVAVSSAVVPGCLWVPP